MKKLLLVMFAIAVSCESLGDAVKFSVQVLDEETERPVSGVNVSAGFDMDKGVLARDRFTCEFKQYETDESGLIKARGSSNSGGAGFAIVRADGYYYPVHGDGLRFRKKNFFGVWQPDNLVVTVKLQRVEHPIPLIVKSVWGHDKEVFPKGKDVLMFDFFAGDWLPPIGKGKTADVKFTRLPTQSFGIGENDGLKAESYRDSMKVEFLGTDNGLWEMPSTPTAALKIRTAPEFGYSPHYLCWKGRSLKLARETNYDKNRCFCFRIRTRRDEKGRIEEAYYGKIYGDITFDFSVNPVVPVASVQMHYYLNPTPLDRNLEWDRKTNLCPNPGDVGDSVGDRQP